MGRKQILLLIAPMALPRGNSLDMSKDEIERQVLASEAVQKWTEGKTPKKVIIIPNKIVNIVV